MKLRRKQRNQTVVEKPQDSLKPNESAQTRKKSLDLTQTHHNKKKKKKKSQSDVDLKSLYNKYLGNDNQQNRENDEYLEIEVNE